MTVAALFADQARTCTAMGSPFTGRVLDCLIPLLDLPSPFCQAIRHFPARTEDALPLRVAGALHALARSGDALAAVYPPHAASDAALTEALRRAVTDHAATLLPWLQGPPQTNEVARSAVLIAVGQWVTARYAMPLVLSELGASAGVNLLWDHYALALPDRVIGPAHPVLTLTPQWTGTLPDARPVVAARAGVDLSPLTARDHDRMLAYVWADQTQRLDRAKAALSLAARMVPDMAQGDAAVWAEARLQRSFPGHVHLLYHTVAAQYFPKATADRLAAALNEAGARATDAAPLAHFGMEGDGQEPGAALTLTLWPGGQTQTLGRADFHGRWVDWHGVNWPR